MRLSEALRALAERASFGTEEVQREVLDTLDAHADVIDSTLVPSEKPDEDEDEDDQGDGDATRPPANTQSDVKPVKATTANGRRRT